MAIVEKLLVTTPLTNDGVNPIYVEGPDGTPIVKVRKSIVEKAARAELEKLNQHRSPVLRETIEVVKVDEATGRVINHKLPSVDAEKELEEKIKAKDAEIEALKKQLEKQSKESKGSKGVDPKSSKDVLHSAETKTEAETKTVE